MCNVRLMIKRIALLGALAGGLSAATLAVGPSQTLKTIGTAVAASHAGDVINVDAGTYTGANAVARIAVPNLTFNAVGGPVILQARDSRNYAINVSLHGIWSIDTGPGLTTVNGFIFTGAAIAVADGNNGSGIRLVTGDLTLNDCGFFYNQDGLLSGATAGKLTINRSHFAFNGAGDGQSHNLYYGAGPELVVNQSISRNANGGQDVKSRAIKTTVTYSLLGEAAPATGGNTNVEFEACNGGVVTLIGNLILQSTGTTNGHIVTTGFEGYAYTLNTLTMLNNTVVGYRSINYFETVVAGLIGDTIIKNNVWVGPGTLYNGALPTQEAGNYVQTVLANAKFMGASDYRFQATSPAFNLGVLGTEALVPLQALIPFSTETRAAWNTPGAFAANSSAAFAIPTIPVPNTGVAVGYEKVGADGTVTPPTSPPPPTAGTATITGILVVRMPDGTLQVVTVK